MLIALAGFAASKPLHAAMARINGHVEQMAGGNFAIDIDPAASAKNDEIGELNRSMELIAEKLSAAIRTIAELSARVRQAGDDMNGSAVKANQAMQQVSHAVEEIARLAQSSAESAESMDALRTAFAAQNEGIGGVRENLASMTKGADAVAEAATKTAGLSQGMDDAKNRLTNEIEGLSAISEENAASTEETSASMNELATSFQTIETAADELKTLAAQLDDELKFFKVKKV